MNISNTGKTNLALNLGTMVSLLIAITIGGFIVANVYDITKKVEHQSIANGVAVNQSLSQLLDLQQANNIRGNDSLVLFKTLLINQIEQANKTLQNQDQYFPQFNASLGNIMNALHNQILDTEYNIIGNLTDHRDISNNTRDQEIDLLKQILNKSNPLD